MSYNTLYYVVVIVRVWYSVCVCSCDCSIINWIDNWDQIYVCMIIIFTWLCNWTNSRQKKKNVHVRSAQPNTLPTQKKTQLGPLSESLFGHMFDHAGLYNIKWTVCKCFGLCSVSVCVCAVGEWVSEWVEYKPKVSEPNPLNLDRFPQWPSQQSPVHSPNKVGGVVRLLVVRFD